MFKVKGLAPLFWGVALFGFRGLRPVRAQGLQDFKAVSQSSRSKNSKPSTVDDVAVSSFVPKKNILISPSLNP